MRKEKIELRIACSYGPGRYDAQYEERGIDYPVGYVRWTENRNMEAVLELMAEKKLNVLPLVTHRFDISKALEAYDVVLEKKSERAVGVLLLYPGRPLEELARYPATASRRQVASVGSRNIRIGFIGAGNFAQSYLIPPLRTMPVSLSMVATRTPIDAKAIAQKFGFHDYTTEALQVLQNDLIDAVVIATRHDSHASFVIEAMRRNKRVFVEKPLAVTPQELETIRKMHEDGQSIQSFVMVGFNRRFSDPFQDIKRFFENVKEPLSITYRVNAGLLPSDHWMNDERQGGRIIGECCHFIDTMMYLTGAKPKFVSAVGVGSSQHLHSLRETLTALLTFSDGSVGTLVYLTNGDNSMPKEYCEVSGGGKSVILDNFKSVKFIAGNKIKKKRYDEKKGHEEEMKEFVDVLTGKKQPSFTFESQYLATLTTFRILEAMRSRDIMQI